jgi:hypothetical protein
MNMKKIAFYGCLLPLLLAAWAAAQQNPNPEKITVPLSDPSRPALVQADVMTGGITVRGYEGREIVVQASYRGGESRREKHPAGTEGMKRIDNLGTGLEITEDNNVVNIDTNAFNRGVDLDIQVPRQSSLKLHAINDGDIRVENVQGEVEVNDLNGAVKLTGDITVVLTEVSPDKPMSFSSMNGNIDVTFPPTLKASIVMQSQNGEIYTDFDVKMDTRAVEPIIQDARDKGGKYKVRIDKAVRGTVGGGGPEFMFKTFNGNIFIRKAGAR